MTNQQFSKHYPDQQLVKVGGWFYDRVIARDHNEAAIEILSNNCAYRDKTKCSDCMEIYRAIKMLCQAKVMATILQDKKEFSYRWEVVEGRYGTGVYLVTPISITDSVDLCQYFSEIIHRKIEPRIRLTPKLTVSRSDIPQQEGDV